MACLDMCNSEHKSLCPPMSPRISFSNDFVDTAASAADHSIKRERICRDTPVSSDFEFSVSNYKMIAADELFSKGRLLPFKDNCTNQLQKMTLRDELLVDLEGDDDGSSRPPKGPIRWKELLGLKKNHIVAKKGEKTDGSLERGGRSSEEAFETKKASQELWTEGGVRFRDLEIGI